MLNECLKCLAGGLVIALLISIFLSRYGFALNTSESLPYKIFFVEKGLIPIKCGQYAIFNINNSRVQDLEFVKIVAGVPGDLVQGENREIYINNNLIAIAKEYSKSGDYMEPIENVVIPEDHYFVYSNHEDSYDSRYEEIGLIPSSNILGVAHPIW